MAALGVALCSGCHGELTDLDPFDGSVDGDDAGSEAMAPDLGSPAADAAASGGEAGAPDLAAPTGPTFITAIQADLDGLGCAATGPCHAGTAPMKLIALARDDRSLRANWAQVLPRASADAASALLVKNLQGSGVSHIGGARFAAPGDPIYQRWLAWIRAGAPYQPAVPDGGGP